MSETRFIVHALFLGLSLVALSAGPPAALALVNARELGASGSAQVLTGSITAGSDKLVLDTPADFKDGQGLEILGAGPKKRLRAPGAPAVTANGARGRTTYSYACAAVDNHHGFSPAGRATTIRDGSSTLTHGDTVLGFIGGRIGNNTVVCPHTPGALYYIIYRALGDTPLEYYDISSTGHYVDVGTHNINLYFPETPPTEPRNGPLFATIQSGGGTTRLVLTVRAQGTVQHAMILHEDSKQLQNGLDEASGSEFYIPAGVYYVGASRLNLPLKGIRLVGDGADRSILRVSPGAQMQRFVDSNVKSGAIEIRGIAFDGNAVSNGLNPAGQFGAGVRIYAPKVIFLYNEVANIPPGLGTPNFGLELVGPADARFDIENNYIHDVGIGGGNPDDDANQPKGRSAIGVYCEGGFVRFVRNTLIRCRDAAFHFNAESRSRNIAIVRHNVVKDCAIGIRVEAQRHDEPVSARISDNWLRGGGYDLNDAMIELIYSGRQNADPCRPIEFVGKILRNSVEAAPYSMGILADGVTQATIAFNTLRDVARQVVAGPAAIHVRSASNTDVIENTVEGTGSSCLMLDGDRNVNVVGNRLRSCDEFRPGSYPGILISGLINGFPWALTSPQQPSTNIAVYGNRVNGKFALQLGLNPSDSSSNIWLRNNTLTTGIRNYLK